VAVVLYEAGKENIYCWGDARTSPTAVKVAPDTVFGIGSVTKTFTSTLLASKIGGGGLKLDNKVISLLPAAVKEQHKEIAEVTLVMLATHTAGFPESGPTGETLFQDKPPAHDLLTFWEDWTNQSKHGIGTHYAYSNVGMITLGYAVAGNNYNGLLQQDLCGPLRMTRTGPGAFLPAGSKLAQGHLEQGGKTVAIQTQNSDLNSNPNSMMLYLKAQLGATKPPKGSRRCYRSHSSGAFPEPREAF
jgi:D-alanyl-D-alanine-carboxypeptidase/D-alanyl-D-alanine-endopeptidase